MSDKPMTARRTELRRRIAEVLDEYSDVLSMEGQHQIALESGRKSLIDWFTEEDLEDDKVPMIMSGWVLVVAHDPMDPMSDVGTGFCRQYPDGQSFAMTRGLLEEGGGA